MSILYFAKIVMVGAVTLMALVMACGILIGLIHDLSENHEDEA